MAHTDIFTLPSPFSEDFNRRREEGRKKAGLRTLLGPVDAHGNRISARSIDRSLFKNMSDEQFAAFIRRRNQEQISQGEKFRAGIDQSVVNDPAVADAIRKVNDAKASGNRQDMFLAMARLGLVQKQALDRQRQAGVISRAANVAIGQQVAQAQAQFQSSAGRRGLAFSGVEQAGIQAINAAGAGQVASTVAGAQAELFEAQRREIEAFERGVFNFITGMFTLAQQAAFQQQLLRFQHDLEGNNDWEFWSELGGSIASLAILAAML